MKSANNLSDYHNMFKVSQFFCFFVEPMVHPCMVFDYLIQGNCDQDSDFDAVFKAFLKTDMINVPDPLFGDTTLHIAFQNKRFDVLEELIRNQGDVFQVNSCASL